VATPRWRTRRRPGVAPIGLALVLASATFARPLAAADGAVAGAGSVPSPAVAAVTEQPRPFGYVVGDLLTQRVLLQRDGKPFLPAALPLPARLGVWFQRRAAHVETAADGRRWLVVDYQVVNAPTAVEAVRLAAWDLPGADGVLRVPAWDLTVAPLTAAASAPGQALRPDRPAPSRDAAGERRRLMSLATALGACVLAWLGWIAWRARLARRSQPFARALHEMNARPSSSDAAQPRRILHAAFDRAAAQVVRSANLPRLFERAPHLVPLRARIETFFAQSEALFFAGPHSPPHEVEPAPALCRDLRRLERAAEH
jgi:mxaA protein